MSKRNYKIYDDFLKSGGENAWQKEWDEWKLYQADDFSKKEKKYVLVEFPYPSGVGLHVGHVRSYTALDVMSRKLRMQGYNVMYPIGWDAFGLPTENYAIKNKIHPRAATEQNIATFKKQMKSLGLSFDWPREVDTTDPKYYRWTQWIFLQLYKKGLAYKKKMPINWCPSCKIGLANEEVVDGKCERCGAVAEQREKEQWMLAITKYADKLIKDLDTVDYLDKIKTQQINWIGKSEGAEIEFKVPINVDVRLGFKTQPNDTSNHVDEGFKTQPNDENKTTWFLTFSTKEREEFFDNKEECLYIMNAIFNSCLKHNFILHEISVMKDHIHLILDTDKNIPVEKIYKYLKGYSAKKFNDRFGRDLATQKNSKGFHLWTPKGEYSIIKDEKRYKSVLRYIQNNPEKDRLNKKERLFSENLNNLYYILKIFTTRPDTLFGATYMVLAPEHELIKILNNADVRLGFKTQPNNKLEVEKYIKQAQKKNDLQRASLEKEKTGVELKGIKAVNPANNEAIPVWIADYVLASYGTGAIMAVPAHDERDWEFAKKFNLPVKFVIHPKVFSYQKDVDTWQTVENIFSEKDKNTNDWLTKRLEKIDRPVLEVGKLINSDKFVGLHSVDAKKEIIEYVGGIMKTQYKLRDWIFSRQHYWGEPIPIIYCHKCWEITSSKSQIPKLREGIDYIVENGVGYIIHSVSEKDLPVELPEVEHYEPTDTGESPLAVMKNWVNTKCPQCGGNARRETDTMPNWAGSSWYFLRYCDPENNKALADAKKLKYWLPVDLYNGGMEHTTLHLLYSRFWNKFLYDCGVVPVSEPYARRVSHGMVLAEDGKKMSKSLGNVINPDEIIKNFGADSLRLYEMFMGPFSETIPWSTEGVKGVRRFLEKIWDYFESWESSYNKDVRDKKENKELYQEESLNDRINTLLHKTIKKITEDIESMKFNTAVSAMMIFVNRIRQDLTPEKVINRNIIVKSQTLDANMSIPQLEKFLIILAPFAPHIAEELWFRLGNKESIFKQSWPKYDERLTKDEIIQLVVQINGKLRDIVEAAADISEAEAKEKALASEKIKKWTEGKKAVKVIFVKNKLVNIVIK